MCGARGQLRRRVIGQLRIPSVESGVAAADGIVLVPPVIIFVRQFVERDDLSGLLRVLCSGGFGEESLV